MGNDGRRDSALLEVAEGVEAISGPGQSDTDPVVRPQKAHGPLLVAPDQGQDDDIILLSLVVVHGRHAHICLCKYCVIQMNIDITIFLVVLLIVTCTPRANHMVQMNILASLYSYSPDRPRMMTSLSLLCYVPRNRHYYSDVIEDLCQIYTIAKPRTYYTMITLYTSVIV